MMGFVTTDAISYSPINGFTTVDLGCERGNNSYNMVNRMEAPFSTQYMQLFAAAGIAFLMYLDHMKPHDELSLDVDWLYRKPLPILMNWLQ